VQFACSFSGGGGGIMDEEGRGQQQLNGVEMEGKKGGARKLKPTFGHDSEPFS
jgi:hypothetical protein